MRSRQFWERLFFDGSEIFLYSLFWPVPFPVLGWGSRVEIFFLGIQKKSCAAGSWFACETAKLRPQKRDTKRKIQICLCDVPLAANIFTSLPLSLLYTR